MKTLGIARKVSPTFHKRYIPHISFSVRKINKLSEAAQSQKPLHYVIITDSKKIRVSFTARLLGVLRESLNK